MEVLIIIFLGGREGGKDGSLINFFLDSGRGGGKGKFLNSPKIS